MKRKNLVVLHLESIAWQALHAFPEAFPNLARLMAAGRVFRRYFSSATSTQMVLAFLLHGNDFEFDAAEGIAAPAANNPSLFSTLEAAGYRTGFLCVSALEAKTMLPLLAGTLPPVWKTSDFAALLEKFAATADRPPFAVYFWNLVTHVEHALALKAVARGVEDVIGGACAVADHALGQIVEILERRNLMPETTVVIFGDHGDDYWTHGFKKGILHGIEPYTNLVHAPLVILDSALPAGDDHRLAATIDLAPTCLELINVPVPLPFAESGQSLLRGAGRAHVFSQNFAANQPDNADWDIRKAFAVHDGAYCLLATSRGLELFNYRLDPANHCNLLHFFERDPGGALAFDPPPGFAHPHFAAAMRVLLGENDAVKGAFARLHPLLREQVGKKNAYASLRKPARLQTLDPACLDTINRDGRDRFFARPVAVAPPVSATAPLPPRAAPPERSRLAAALAMLFGRGGEQRQ